MVADATALHPITEELGEGAQLAQAVRIFVDPSGSAWTQIYVPISEHSVNQLLEMHAAGVIALEVQALPEVDFRATEMAWLQAHDEELAHTYAGQWIAIDGQTVVARAPDLPTLIQRSTEAGHPHPFVTLVSAEPSVPFFGCR